MYLQKNIYVALSLSLVIVLSACSESAGDTDPISKTNEPPVTSIFPKQEYISSEKPIRFTCSDPNIGDNCVSTFFSYVSTNDPADNPTFGIDKLFTKEFDLSDLSAGNGDTIHVKYYSIDSVGTIEKAKTKTYLLDKEAPTAILSHPAGTSTTAIDLTIDCEDSQLSATIPGSGCESIYYYVTVDSTITPSIDTYEKALPGALTIYMNTTSYLFYFAEDRAGNRSVVPDNGVEYTFVNAVDNVSDFAAVSELDRVELSWGNPGNAGLKA